MIGVSEIEALMRCVLCKGSQYPQTTPRPTVVEIPLVVPLCDHESDRSIKEATLWQCGTNPHEQQETLLSLIAVRIIKLSFFYITLFHITLFHIKLLPPDTVELLKFPIKTS